MRTDYVRVDLTRAGLDSISMVLVVIPPSQPRKSAVLLSLSIEQLAVIASQSLRFGPGLVAITGETGAGKSVILAALALVLGGRGSVELVRTGADGSLVEARFSLADAPEARALLRRADLPGADDEELVIRRTLSARGAGRASVNGRNVPLGLLTELGRTLVDSASQHDQHGLLDPGTHLQILDRGANLEALAGQMGARWEAVLSARGELGRLLRAARDAEERASWLRFQLSELDQLAPLPGEEESLQAERRLLQHAAELGAGVRAAEALLYSGDGAALDRLAGAEAALRRLAGLDPSLDATMDQLRELVFQVEDAARTLQARARVAVDPGRLDAVETRLAELERVARKQRCAVADLPLRRATIQQELEEVLNLDEATERARATLAGARDAALETAAALSARRAEAARTLEGRVERELTELAMPHARFQVCLLPCEEGEPLPDGRVLGPSGLERAELRLSANPGEDLRPLHRVASGGELSRVLLALKIVLREGSPQGRVPVMVFDEVDSGLGGLAAEEIGRKLLALSDHAQVLCVTHLPQIAALADQQLGVSKRVEDGRTRTEVTDLVRSARAEEIARMLGGELGAAQVFAARLLRARGPRRARRQEVGPAGAPATGSPLGAPLH